MRQRFLNQKLGKRTSRKAELRRAKLFAEKTAVRRTKAPARPVSTPAKSG